MPFTHVFYHFQTTSVAPTPHLTMAATQRNGKRLCDDGAVMVGFPVKRRQLNVGAEPQVYDTCSIDHATWSHQGLTPELDNLDHQLLHQPLEWGDWFNVPPTDNCELQNLDVQHSNNGNRTVPAGNQDPLTTFNDLIADSSFDFNNTINSLLPSVYRYETETGEPHKEGVPSLQSSNDGSCTPSTTPDTLHPSVELDLPVSHEPFISRPATTKPEQTILQIERLLLQLQQDPCWEETIRTHAWPEHLRSGAALLYDTICSSPVAMSTGLITPLPRVKILASQSRTKTLTSKKPSLGPAKRSNAELWYRHFMKLGAKDFVVPDALQHYLDKHPRHFLDVPALVSNDLAYAPGANVLAQRVSYILALSTSTEHHAILFNISCLFFFIVSHGFFYEWDLRCRDSITPKTWNSKRVEIFSLLHPDSRPDQSNPAFRTFVDNADKWRSKGAHLAYFAQGAGLGSIVLLHHYLRDLWGATRGGEKRADHGIFGHEKPSKAVARHLREQGILYAGRQTGAERFVENVLKELLRGIPGWERILQEEGFPGFEQL